VGGSESGRAKRNQPCYVYVRRHRSDLRSGQAGSFFHFGKKAFVRIRQKTASTKSESIFRQFAVLSLGTNAGTSKVGKLHCRAGVQGKGFGRRRTQSLRLAEDM
jgi:hypothetical protein